MTVISLAIALILIAILMGFLGVFLQGAQWLLWIGIFILIGGVILYVVNSRRGPPAV